MSTTIKLLTALAIAPLSTLWLGCDTLECGEGTTEVNGVCVAADGEIPENIYCAQGTHWDPATQGCIPDLEPTECEEGTTQIVLDPERGIFICQGIGGGDICERPCPQPTAGKNTVCGRLTDAETGEYIEMADADGTDCLDIPAGDRTGPCLLDVLFYDALGFAQNPTGTAPLPTDELFVNNCGWYMGTNIPTPALGYMAVGAEDSDGAADTYVLSGVAFPVAPGERFADQKTYVARHASDETWTDTAGYPFGATTFAGKGVFMPIFSIAGEVPVTGVKITRDPAGVVPADDFYFDDTDPTVRSSVNVTQDSTGPNGAGLMINSPLVDHAGTGGDNLPAGCVWEPELAKSIPTVVFANERWAKDSEGEDCQP